MDLFSEDANSQREEKREEEWFFLKLRLPSFDVHKIT